MKEWTEFIKSGGQILAGTAVRHAHSIQPQGDAGHCKLPAASEDPEGKRRK